MKTKFLLHGGRLKNKDPRNDAYFKELTKGLKDGDEVLHISFARQTQAERDEIFKNEKRYILAQTKADLNIVYATKDDLINQIKSAKAIHITGGETPKLVKMMQRYSEFLPALRGKKVEGSSAGACLFSTYYFSCRDSLEIFEGLGVLPIRLMVHYGNPNFNGTDESLSLLKAYPENLELIALEEAEWIVKQAEL